MVVKLDDISSGVYFAFRKAQVEGMGTERLGKTHVSDLIKPCMRYVAYSKFTPKTSDTEDIKSLFFGQAVHNITVLNDEEHNEMFLAYDYVKDEPLTREEALKIPEDDPRQLDIIYGSIDDLVKVNGEWIICDKKTTGSIDYFSKARSSASESHVDQINRYRVLLKKCYNIDAKYGAVIYISNGIEKEKKDKPQVKPFKLADIEETLADMVEKARTIKGIFEKRLLPERTKCFLCDGFCPYATKCFTDEGDTIEEG